LAALPGLHLDTVDKRSDRDTLERKRTTSPNRRIGSRLNRVSGFRSTRRKYVTPLTVSVKNQRKMRTAIRIVLDTLDATCDPVLVALEVDDTVVALVTTSAVPSRDAPMVVAATGLGFRG
jgi:hypothetical protein